MRIQQLQPDAAKACDGMTRRQRILEYILVQFPPLPPPPPPRYQNIHNARPMVLCHVTSYASYDIYLLNKNHNSHLASHRMAWHGMAWHGIA
ncbi:hypothetical protein EYC84_009193 [Monilinia fructicola]|uniref:Uncharacterized protein n=1 Tax=Monilinia fructicola TaxID=38448 RepID=A0A5M9JHQ8_MONFR|nr:hypothetical protein EYC84_009193 [Monilinia fructicola]